MPCSWKAAFMPACGQRSRGRQDYPAERVSRNPSTMSAVMTMTSSMFPDTHGRSARWYQGEFVVVAGGAERYPVAARDEGSVKQTPDLASLGAPADVIRRVVVVD